MAHDLSKSSAWAGVWTALVTPLLPGLQLDEKGLATLIQEQIKLGVRGLVVAGSTGEGSLLPAATFERLLQRARELSKGEIPLVAGLGIGGTEACLRNLEIARKANFDGVLAAPPAYIKAPQRGLMTHFLKIAEQGLPVCLYEIPGRAASSLENSTIIEMVEKGGKAAAHIVALKDASGDLTRPLALKRQLGDRLALLSGEDATYAAFLFSGGDGVVSVLGHVALPALLKITDLAKKGEVKKAGEEQARLWPLIQALFFESNPIPVKSLLAAQKKIQDFIFCPPLCPMRPDLLEKLQAALTEATATK